MMALFVDIVAKIAMCKANYPTDPLEASLKCTINVIGLPIVRAKILQVFSNNETAILEAVNGRVNIWTCEVNTRSNSIANSVGQGINKFTSLDDLLGAVRVSDMVKN